MLVQSQALITQLVFNHALRIRVKAEAANSAPSSAASSATTTPDSASVADPSETAESSANSEDEDETAVSEATSTTKGKGKGSRAASVSGESSKGLEPTASEKAGNLVGKLNNLITTDLNNLTDGRDFLFVGSCPFFQGLHMNH